MSILGFDLLEGVIGGIAGEVDFDDFVSELLVSSSDGGDAAFHEMGINLVEGNLQVAGAVEADALPLADDVAGEHEVVKDGFVDSSKSAVVRSLLALAELNELTIVP